MTSLVRCRKHPARSSASPRARSRTRPVRHGDMRLDCCDEGRQQIGSGDGFGARLGIFELNNERGLVLCVGCGIVRIVFLHFCQHPGMEGSDLLGVEAEAAQDIVLPIVPGDGLVFFPALRHWLLDRPCGRPPRETDWRRLVRQRSRPRNSAGRCRIPASPADFRSHILCQAWPDRCRSCAPAPPLRARASVLHRPAAARPSWLGLVWFRP